MNGLAINNKQPYASTHDFLTAIKQQYDKLSKQLQLVARQILSQHHLIALNGIADLSRQLNITTSSIVRFAKHFGFKGFSQMQLLFRNELDIHHEWGADYRQRIQHLNGKYDTTLTTIINNNINSLQSLLHEHVQIALLQAVQLLLSAKSVWITGCGRSFSVITYLNYMLLHSGHPVHCLHGLGHNPLPMELNALTADDVLIAVSFSPYAATTQDVVQLAKQKSVCIIAISDSAFSPIAQQADVFIEVLEQHTFGFRSLVGSMTVVQALFLILAAQENERQLTNH